MKPPPKTPCLLAASLLAAGTAMAGTIVPDLDDGDAIFSASVASPGVSTDFPTVQRSLGVTLAARVTPTAQDLTNSASGAVAVLEIGGTTSGSGLWILDGFLWFSSSSGSNQAAPGSTLDLDGSDASIGVRIGSITAGESFDAFVSFDGPGLTLVTALNSVIRSHSMTGTESWNWEGNRSVSLATADTTDSSGNAGWRGGLVDNGGSGGALFNTNNAFSLDGTVSLGQIFNAPSSVPEPGVALLASGALLGLARRRRR